MGKRSSVVIGIGGSGSYVVRYLRNKYAEKGIINEGHPGPNNVHYLCIDSWKDETDKTIFRKESELKTTGKCPEFLEIGIDADNYNKYLADNGNFPQITSWLPRNSLATIAAPQNGAGQWRALGRLIFYHNLTKAGGIHQTFLNLIDHVKETQDKMRSEGFSLENGIDFYLIYSVAGGTGAGMFMDIAILIKKLIQQKQMESEKNQINHYAFMPNVFERKIPQKEIPRIMANGYGSLIDFELMHTAERKKSGLNFPKVANPQSQSLYTWHYSFGSPETWVMRNTDRPWTGINLISKRHDQTDTDVKAIVAETLYMIFDESEFGQELRSIQSNRLTQDPPPYESSVTTDKTVIFKRELQSIYSTFGLAFIRFDRASLVQKAANILGKAFVDNYILRKSTLTEAKKLEIIGDSFIRYADLSTMLEEGSGPFSVPQLINVLDTEKTVAKTYLDVFAEFEKMSSKEFENSYKKIIQKLNSGEFESFLKKQAGKLFPDLKSMLNNSFIDWINQFGLNSSVELLRTLKANLEKTTNQIREITASLDSVTKEEDPPFERLEDAENLSIGSFRKDALKIVREQLKDECEARIKELINLRILPVIFSIYSQLLKSIGSKETNNTFEGSCEEFLSWARTLSESFTREAEVLNQQAKGDETYCVNIKRTINEEEIKNQLWSLLSPSATFPGEIDFGYENLSKIYTDIAKAVFKSYDASVTKSGLEEITIGKLVSILIPPQENIRPPYKKDSVIENLKKTITSTLDCSNTTQIGNNSDIRLLNDFGKNIKITEILERENTNERRDNYYTQLVNKASLLFDRTTKANILNQKQATHAKPASILGIYKGDSQFSAKIERDILAKHTDGRLKSKDSGEDTIFIYKDLIHLPACFYSELDSLKAGYESNDTFAKRDLVHFDFNYFKNDLVDLCYVDPNLATFIEDNASKIILAIVLKIIAFDKTNGTLRFIYQGSRISLGMDLYNVINYLHGQSEILTNIHELLETQIRQIKERQDKSKAIHLVNAIRLFRLRISEAVMGNPNNYPLFRLVSDTLIPQTEKYVSYKDITIPQKTKVDGLWDLYLSNVSDESIMNNNINNYKAEVEGWYEICSPDLPIPVIKQA